MRKGIKQVSIIAIVLIFASFLAIGCTPARRPVPETNRYDRMNSVYDNDTIPDRYGDNDLTYDNIPNNLGINLTLEREVERIPGVRDAVIIVDNNTAYVGIKANTRTNINMKALQTSVASKIREKMPNIVRVYVTSDPNKVERLRDYKEDIRRGKPIRDLINRIEDLF
ncbi:YhcN/YlaJ family sporulation lipoprotein [Crassaminicella thermophila]|uniref:YhcN/YlaJ family sporulation lipoprotein n=1 Tax=Crassaminicella thermophila TaxID=2599308 RepID=UPI001A9B51DC|nr:YhcN/YlaJ family sporulation lipoprotein [Crassaminicella thermophila]